MAVILFRCLTWSISAVEACRGVYLRVSKQQGCSSSYAPFLESASGKTHGVQMAPLDDKAHRAILGQPPLVIYLLSTLLARHGLKAAYR